MEGYPPEIPLQQTQDGDCGHEDCTIDLGLPCLRLIAMAMAFGAAKGR